MTDYELVESAVKAIGNSYSPYSGFKVSAALLCKNGKVYNGVNIENSSYSATVCAERTAFFSAISDNNTEFERIAVVGGKNGEITDFCYPCGVCRQVMSEFCNSDFEIVLYNGKEIKKFELNKLLPYGFNLE